MKSIIVTLLSAVISFGVLHAQELQRRTEVEGLGLPSSGNFTGGVSTIASQGDNSCVPNVEDQFLQLKRHADTSGFYLGFFSEDTKCWLTGDCDCMNHYQGIVRAPGPGVPHMYISKDGNPEVIVVRMGSRDADGERLRSNRLSLDYITDFTWPPFNDGEIAAVQFPDMKDLGLRHAGAMHVIGKTLVVPFECDEPKCFGQLSQGQGAVVLLDLSNPGWPIRYYTQFFPHLNGGNAMAQLPDGRYLLLIAGEGGPALTAYISNVTDLHNPNLFFQFFGTWNNSSFGYDHFSLVKQCDGELYVIGTRRNQIQGGCGNPINDAELWKLGGFASGGFFSLNFVRTIELNCANPYSGVACDFQAAGGTYISPSGELILYGTVHQQGDPFTAFAEFRHRDTEHPTAQPWLQLYSEPSGWNLEPSGMSSASGRSVVFEMPDRHKDNFLNFPLLDFFDNSASSVRWRAPVGCCMELITNPCTAGSTGTVLKLEGTGEVETISNLGNTVIGDNNVSAVRFCSNVAEPYSCNPPTTCPQAACNAIGPDLIVRNVVADSCVNQGQSIQGTVTIENIGNKPAFGFMDIGFSLSVDNNPHGGGDDIPMGTLDLNIQPPLQPGQTRSFTFNTPFVQNNSIQTNQNFFACVDLGAPPCGMICETCEVNNCSSTNVRIGKPDVAIPDITYPSPKISGEQVPITVSIQNFGCDSVCNNTTACIGMGPGSNCVTKPFCIDPFDIKQVTIDVQAPLSEFDCGSVDYFNISACHSVPDANVTNNCRNETIGITEQFWDLDLSIVGGDNSAGLGDSVDYTVRVTNNGNMPSPNCLAFITGINCSPGPGQWGCVLDSVPFKQIGTVQPGQTKSFNIGLDIAQCCVPPIKIGQQWLKAEILYTQGEACDDDCGEGSGNNLHQEPIQITF